MKEDEQPKDSNSTYKEAARKAWKTIRREKHEASARISRRLDDFITARKIISIRHPEGSQSPQTKYGIIIRQFAKTPENIVCGKFWELRWAYGCSERYHPILRAREEICLISLDEAIIQQWPTVEVSYYSQFGDLKWVLILLYNENRVITIRQEEERPGILLNVFEKFFDLLRHLVLRLKMRGKWDKAKWYVGYEE